MNTETPRYRSFRRGSGTKAAPFGRRFVAGAIFPRWLTAILAIAALLWATTALAHENDGYSHDSSTSQLRMSWMAGLSGDSRISELSLPGTHDTMSFYGGDAVQTQSFSLPHQLDAGIRVLDIRARHIDNVFAIHHGVVYQHAMFGGDVMKPIAQFLRAHPTETVLIRLKEEYDPSNNSRSFAETFLAYMNSYDAEIQGVYGDYVWRPNGAVNPTLAQVRGKVVFMLPPSGFDSTTLSAWGIPYDDSAVMSIQDDYNLSTNWDLYSKWERVRDHLYAADRGSRNLIYMNYLSGSGGSFPYFVASGHSSPGTGAPRLATGLTTPGWDSSYPDFPRVDCWWNIFVWGDTCTIAFEGTNILTKNLLRTGRLGRVGIVMADFPGAGLIDAVIARNRVVTFVGKSGFNGKCLDLDVASSNTASVGLSRRHQSTVDLREIHRRDSLARLRQMPGRQRVLRERLHARVPRRTEPAMGPAAVGTDTRTRVLAVPGSVRIRQHEWRQRGDVAMQRCVESAMEQERMIATPRPSR